MQGKYSGSHMQIYGHIHPGSARLANWSVRTNLTVKAKHRLKVVDWLRNHEGDISLTARHFGLDRKTVRSWRDKFKKQGMLALNDKSHRPKNVRCPVTDWKVTAEIERIRKENPAWSKYKIKKILERKNMHVSASTVGRILKRKGLIDKRISKKKSKAAKNPKMRYPKGFRIISAGDMVQMDTKFVTLLGGRMIYQFTAIDVLTKRRILKYHSSLLSKNGAAFLRYCLTNFPFPIKSIQTDNGKEFLGDFDKLCQKLRLPHYFIEPRHPKQNTYVENSHGFDEREFYQQGNMHKDIAMMDKALERWEYKWNYIRPHQALNYLTPDEYFQQIKLTKLKAKEAIILQT